MDIFKQKIAKRYKYCDTKKFHSLSTFDEIKQYMIDTPMFFSLQENCKICKKNKITNSDTLCTKCKTKEIENILTKILKELDIST